MSAPRSPIWKEIDKRIKKVRTAMEEIGYSALLVYGNNKVFGSLRYLTDYFPVLAGWVSLSATETHIFEGAALAFPSIKDEPILLLDAESISKLRKEICTKNVLLGGLSPKNIAEILEQAGVKGKVGIETWDIFPVPLYLGIRELLPTIVFERSTIVEELRMIKTPFEIELFRKAGMVGDAGHEAFVENLRNGIGKTELELTRAAEHVMRCADPIYEDSCNCSASLICSGFASSNNLLHLPDHTKRIQKGDMVHWDITMRYEGYSIDTSRTKAVGKPTDLQKHVFEITLEMSNQVITNAKSGVKTSELVEIADRIAKESGFELRGRFLGHGLGLDVHERPDMGAEDIRLAANMVLAIEPRIHVKDVYIAGVEDMVLVTDVGGEPLTNYEKTLEL